MLNTTQNTGTDSTDTPRQCTRTCLECVQGRDELSIHACCCKYYPRSSTAKESLPPLRRVAQASLCKRFRACHVNLCRSASMCSRTNYLELVLDYAYFSSSKRVLEIIKTETTCTAVSRTKGSYYLTCLTAFADYRPDCCPHHLPDYRPDHDTVLFRLLIDT